MRIQIVKVEVENKGKYRVANVTHYDDKGKLDNKKIMSFEKETFKALSEAKQGDLFDVKFIKNEKDGKTYWNWEVSPAGKNTEAPTKAAAASAAVRSTYETAEERAKRQVYIVRQSSVTAALGLAELNKAKGPITEEDIIKSARKFEAYVFDVETDVETPVISPAEVS